MRTQTLKRYLTYSLLVAGFMLPAASAKAQERRVPPVEVALPVVKSACPRPISSTIPATTPNVVNADFVAAQLTPPLAGFNDPLPNKRFLHTFRWRREENCCEITRAVLTVKMKSNQVGQSKTSSDAGNDGIGIMYLGSVVQPYSQAVYSAPTLPYLNSFPTPTWPLPAGQPSTKQWILTGAVLNNMNASQRLSIYVQDDTTVESATLQIWGCCLSSPRRTATEESPLTNSPN